MITLEAAKQVADDSPDHICPVGAIRDNFTSQGLIAEVKDGFDDEQISMLDLGCAGGQFVVDFIKEGDIGVGLEGSSKPVAFTPSGQTINEAFTGVSISGSCDSFRHRLYDLDFNNTTELNSTVYFCRAGHSEFNYSSNPTYLENSKIRVKSGTGTNEANNPPVSYITTVGLYSADNELLAVAKLSEPIKKTTGSDLTLRVRLDY